VSTPLAHSQWAAPVGAEPSPSHCLNSQT